MYFGHEVFKGLQLRERKVVTDEYDEMTLGKGESILTG